MAFPTQVALLSRMIKKRFPHLEITLHFHDTRGLALANTVVALSGGIDRFDSSAGGLGGCPYGPGASGNVCTEDMVHMLKLMDFQTNVDFSALLDISRDPEPLIGHKIHGAVLKAGHRSDLHQMAASLEQNFNSCIKQGDQHA